MKGSTAIEIQRYAGRQANGNSYLLSDAENVIVVDLLRNSAAAEELADHVEASTRELAGIFITRGHPDHYLGLNVFHRRFPDVPVNVASAEIRDVRVSVVSPFAEAAILCYVPVNFILISARVRTIFRHMKVRRTVF
jgi:glyoxylase-like metal-dependent hydrolase (beta-lactamase superfamily II)